MKKALPIAITFLTSYIDSTVCFVVSTITDVRAKIASISINVAELIADTFVIGNN